MPLSAACRDRRSACHEDDEDARGPDNLSDRREERPHGRSLVRGRARLRVNHSCG